MYGDHTYHVTSVYRYIVMCGDHTYHVTSLCGQRVMCCDHTYHVTSLCGHMIICGDHTHHVTSVCEHVIMCGDHTYSTDYVHLPRQDKCRLCQHLFWQQFASLRNCDSHFCTLFLPALPRLNVRLENTSIRLSQCAANKIVIKHESARKCQPLCGFRCVALLRHDLRRSRLSGYSRHDYM